MLNIVTQEQLTVKEGIIDEKIAYKKVLPAQAIEERLNLEN